MSDGTIRQREVEPRAAAFAEEEIPLRLVGPSALVLPTSAALVNLLIDYGCPRGGSIIDPFMGSGSVLLVARFRGLSAVGIDADERYCEMVANHLRTQGVPE
jgi:tRNA G10  N-methylase Trm11